MVSTDRHAASPAHPKHSGWEYKTRKPVSLAVTLRLVQQGVDINRVARGNHSRSLTMQDTILMQLLVENREI